MALPAIPKATIEYLAVGLISVAIALGISEYIHSRTPVRPLTPTEIQFRSLGKTYGPQLPAAYAQAYLDGATALEGGATYSAAHAAVAKSISDRRIDLFDKQLTPALTKLIPEGLTDDKVTAAQRKDMAAAWRSLAEGLQSR